MQGVFDIDFDVVFYYLARLVLDGQCHDSKLLAYLIGIADLNWSDKETLAPPLLPAN